MLHLLIAAALVAAPDTIAAGWSLSGQVTDTAGAPIDGAVVVIEEAHRSTRTDSHGNYHFRDVPSGVYGVSFRAIGYHPRVVRLTMSDRDVTVDVSLSVTVIELPPIQTTATPLATSALESPQPLAVLQGAELRRAQAPSIGAVLDGSPGVRSYSTGNGIAKPVIRGMTGNRVLVLDNGQRTESQQWGDEHAPNVETASAERIEVVRGPASVLYGSDALGGAINVVPRELPDAGGGSPLLSGRIDGSFTSNGSMPDGVVMVEGAVNRLGFRGSLSGRESGDVSTPTGTLGNSGLAMFGGSAAMTLRSAWGTIGGSYSRRNERVEIHEDPEEEPDATPFQRIATDRATISGNLSLGSSRLEMDLGWENNARREFESVDAESDGEVELGLRASTWTGNLHLHHAASSRVAGVVGVQALRTSVTTSGEESLVPGSRTTNIAAYGFEQADLGPWQLSVGARVDHRVLDNDAADELGTVPGSRDWTAITGNAGVLYRLGEHTAAVFNVGRGFRAPSAFELFANGEHEGTRRYEVGDAGLATERSLNADLAIRVQRATVRGEIGVFNNRISGYIYPDPTDEVDEESGLQIFRIVQGDATLRGIEGTVEVHPSGTLHFKGGVDYTWGRNDETGRPLAFIAPLRVQGSIRLERNWIAVFDQPWMEFGVQVNAKATRIDPEDFAPDGYTLARLGAGASVAGIDITVQVDNLFDTTYRGFLSRYKRYADEMGRNLKVGVGMDL
ncbi:MAG TPA: TonB-dependent receptor [Gemmatimonadales bacterium]|nr:TonB-dependent receptor [Gemmatimonadales bacterium]